MGFEGYTSASSVPAGSQIDFHLNSDTPVDFSVEIVRVSRANAVVLRGTGHVDPQPTPADAYERGAGWASAFSAEVGADWPSWLYRANFSAGSEQVSPAFVVRPTNPASTSTILLQTCTTTEQAYNDWGGKSLYPSPGSPGAADRGRRVSYDRPGGDYYRLETQFLLWMEDNGLAAEVCSGVDLHAGAIPLEPYALLLSVGHDEYWSKEMRDAVERFIAGGGNVAFFSGNTCWWQVRFEGDTRTMVCYKSAGEDPLTGQDDTRVTVNWFDFPVNRPENFMTGVGFRNGAGHWTGGTNAAYTVAFPDHWAFDGTGLTAGATFADGFVGYETDAALFDPTQKVPCPSGRDGTPLDFQILATADLSGWEQFGQPGLATMGVYQRNGTVFTAASTDWTAGLDDATVGRITRNVVERLSALKPPHLWEQVGHASGMKAMCGLSWWAETGPGSGRFLFGAADDNRLWRRRPETFNEAWEDIGEADAVVAMAGFDARLYAITADGALWQRTAELGVAWTQQQQQPPPSSALAAADGRLYVATKEGGSLLSGALSDQIVWDHAGAAEDVVSMAAIGGRLVAVTGDSRLLSLSLARLDAPWEEIGTAPGIIAIGALDGILFGADKDGRLWVRTPIRGAL